MTPRRSLPRAAPLLLALVLCSSAVTACSNANDPASDAQIRGADGVVAADAQPRDGRAVGDATDSGGGADAAPAESFEVTLDNAPATLTNHFCGDVEDAQFRSLVVSATLADGTSLSINYLYGYAGGGGHAPLGVHATGHDGTSLLTISMFHPGDTIAWSGKGTVDVVASGASGTYEGSASGTLSLDSPFVPIPPPPVAFSIAWKHHAKP